MHRRIYNSCAFELGQRGGQLSGERASLDDDSSDEVREMDYVFRTVPEQPSCTKVRLVKPATVFNSSRLKTLFVEVMVGWINDSPFFEFF